MQGDGIAQCDCNLWFPTILRAYLHTIPFHELLIIAQKAVFKTSLIINY